MKLQDIDLSSKNVSEQIREIITKATNWDNFCDLGYEEDMVAELIDYLQDPNEDYYVGDLITEIADSFVEIYTAKLFDLYANNLELLGWFEEASAQGLTEGTDDLIKMLQMGQHVYNKYLLYGVVEHLNIEY